MRQRLIYILKHNQLLQKMYIVVMSSVFRTWGKALHVDDNLVIFVSFMGMNFNDSPKVIYDYMKSHDEYNHFHCVWAFDDPSKFPGVESVKIDTPEYFKTALRAKYWVTNTNIERGLKFKKPDTIYLNTWHGIALKHIGNDCPGRDDYNFDTVNYLVVSGDHDEKVFKSAFKARKESYLRCGMPRNEVLWQATDEMKREKRKLLGISENKKVILYAPTWRDSTDGGATYSIKPPVDFDRWKDSLGDGYIILFRAHHQTTKVMGVKYDEYIINASDYPNVNDLMIASDMLITDYSAIAFDYSILCRPIFCFAYDYDEYLSTRGTYFEIDDMYPNKSCRSEEELLLRIQNMDYQKECDNTKRFRDSFIQYGEESTRICTEHLFQ